MKIKVKDGQKVVFIGDSITDCLRQSSFAPLGNGFVKIFADMLLAKEPAKKVEVVNKGISGDRITGLNNRWTDDVIRQNPDWLVIKIGINDLYSHLFHNDQASVSPELYAETFDKILGRTKKELPKCKILLISPFFMSTDSGSGSLRSQVLAKLPEYIETVQKMSVKYKTLLIKTHDIFQEQLKYRDINTFCNEPVHPNQTGHIIIADAIYGALSG